MKPYRLITFYQSHKRVTRFIILHVLVRCAKESSRRFWYLTGDSRFTSCIKRVYVRWGKIAWVVVRNGYVNIIRYSPLI